MASPVTRLLRRLPSSWVVGLATLGPLGQRMPAPGTWGSLAGTLYFTVGFTRMPWWEVMVVTALVSLVAVAVCGEAEVRLGRQDPGEVILDEFVVMPLCFLGWRGLLQFWPGWALLSAGFALFRFFDIVKPLGIKRTQNLPGGWGVVVDDVVAALAACGSLHLLVHLWLMR
jgi:phosphatidylglycerophosphatase A